MTTKTEKPIWRKRSTYDDYVSKEADGYNAWAYICTAHVKEFKVPEDHLATNPCDKTTCGVKECKKQADFYCEMFK